MPDLMDKKDTDVYKTMSGFQFSAVEMDQLEASEYTLAVILCDETSSVDGFERDLEKAIKESVKSCQKSPRSENLLVLVAKFSSETPNTIEEIHGFNLLSNIKIDDYDGKVTPGGMTPLLDATLHCLESMEAQAKILVGQDYLCNGVFFVITDGEENCSTKATYRKIENAYKRIRKEEKLESIQSFLIGVNDVDCKDALDEFKDKAGFNDFVSVGNLTPGKLAKLADWVSQSVSSTSQALGSKSGSQPIQQPSFNI